MWKQIKRLKELRGKQFKEIIRGPNPEESRNRMGRKYIMALKIYLVVKRRSLRTSDCHIYEETSRINFYYQWSPRLLTGCELQWLGEVGVEVKGGNIVTLSYNLSEALKYFFTSSWNGHGKRRSNKMKRRSGVSFLTARYRHVKDTL